MARSDLLRRLFAGHANADEPGFRRAAMELIADERRKNHRLLADDLESALHAGNRPGAGIPPHLAAVPKSRDDRPLLRVTKPSHHLDELVLTAGVRETAAEIVEEHHSRAALTGHGLRPRTKLIMFGAPGTGKTATAHAIAAELSLPVATASLAALTSSFLGDTARNVEAILRFAERTPCVLVLDEFDVLGQERDQQGDHGELRRVAATVLQVLEDVHGESLIAATSNHPGLVDTAVWRRFDEVLAFDRLDETQIAELITLKLRAVRSDVSSSDWASTLAPLSPAEVELVCFDAMRRMVLMGKTKVDDACLSAAWTRMQDRRAFLGSAGARSTPPLR